MKIIHLFFLFFIIYYCNCAGIECSGTEDIYHIIDNTSPDYEYDIELDWTDDDEKTITIPFSEDLGEDEILPLFMNGTTMNTFMKYYSSLNLRDEDDFDTDIIPNNFYKIYNVITNTKRNGNKLILTIKANDFKANSNDVNQKYIKYFCWLECAGANRGRFRQSGIIVTVNNAKFLKLSKYLIGFLLLFL